MNIAVFLKGYRYGRMEMNEIEIRFQVLIIHGLYISLKQYVFLFIEKQFMVRDLSHCTICGVHEKKHLTMRLVFAVNYHR